MLMIKLISTLLFILFLHGNSTPEYTINGRIQALNEGTVLLEQRISGAYITVATAALSDGQFTFTGEVEIPDVFYISIPGKRGKAMFFLENSNITFNAHADSISRGRFEGSSAQDEFQAFNEKLIEISFKVRALQNEYLDALSSGNEALTARLEQEFRVARTDLDGFQEKYIADHPASYITPLILRNIHYGMDGEELEAHLSRLDPALSESIFIKELTQRASVLKLVALGQKAPDFTQNDPEGQPVKLSSLQGNYILIDFWAAWCGPCRQENPNIVAAYQKFHEKGFDILGVSLDQSKEDWLGAIEKDGLIWTQVSDLQGWNNEAARLYGINSIPSNLLLDPEGRIIYKSLRGKALHTELERLFSD
jgi:peroxiredoxin